MMKLLKWVLIPLACLVLLAALFYAEEDWRGKRAWENCQRELKAKGETLDRNAYIPPAVPDEQNFFKAPKMAEWFVGRGETDLSKRMRNPKSGWFGASDQIPNQIQARKYLAWSDQFGPDFKLISTALERPYARIDGDYTQPSKMPVANFITLRIVAQTLAQRAHCYLLLNHPEQALQELTLMRNTCYVLEDPPTGKTITLVAAMINVAIIGLYAEIVTEGLESNTWQEPQLRVLQQQTAEINLLPFLVQSFRVERAGCCQALETMLHRNSTWQMIKHGTIPLFPRGCVYQNLVWIAKLEQAPIQFIDWTNQLIDVKGLNETTRTQSALSHRSPYTMLAVIAVPSFSKAWQTTAHNQTMVNETQIACALERYHLALGHYPEALNALVPRFMKKLPHDLIGGRPLHYHRIADGKFLLYSVGWDEVDDGGQNSPTNLDKEPDYTKGDWVWKN